MWPTAGFTLEETAPDSHKYKYFDQQPTDRKSFFTAVRKEVTLLYGNSLISTAQQMMLHDI